MKLRSEKVLLSPAINKAIKSNINEIKKLLVNEIKVRKSIIITSY